MVIIIIDVSGTGWRVKVDPANHPLSEYEFDVLIGADGKRNTLQGEKSQSETFFLYYDISFFLYRCVFLDFIGVVHEKGR